MGVSLCSASVFKKTLCNAAPRGPEHHSTAPLALLLQSERVGGWKTARRPDPIMKESSLASFHFCSEKAWEEITSLVTPALCRNSLQTVQGRNFAAQNENNHVWLLRWVWGGRQGPLDYRTWKHHAAAFWYRGFDHLSIWCVCGLCDGLTSRWGK